MSNPTPCLRCKNDLPLMMSVPRTELYFYTARLSLTGGATGLQFNSDTNLHPRGRLCEGCTKEFGEWLKETPNV